MFYPHEGYRSLTPLDAARFRRDFDFFVRFENSACCIIARRHLLSLRACIGHTVIGTYAYLLRGFVRADCGVLCCACGKCYAEETLSVCLFELSPSDRHVLALRLCAGWLRCAVQCLGYCNTTVSRCSTTTCSYKNGPQKSKKMEKYGAFKTQWK